MNRHHHIALELLHHLDIHTKPAGGRNKNRDCFWTGLWLIIPAHVRSSELFHEAAHWLVAPPERRHCANYGLSTNEAVQFISKPPGLLISVSEAIVEEEYASILGVALEFHLDADWVWTYDHHQWSIGFFSNCNAPPWPAIRRLMELEQRDIVRNGYPTILDSIAEEIPS